MREKLKEQNEREIEGTELERTQRNKMRENLEQCKEPKARKNPR